MTSTSFTAKQKKYRIYGIAAALLTLAVPFFIMLTNGDQHLATAQSLCPFKLITGLPCPGCGITKSLVAIYEGNIGLSFSYHLFGPFAFAFCIFLLLLLPLELFTQRTYFDGILYNRKLAWGLALALMTYQAVRLVLFIASNPGSQILKESVWA